MKRLMATALVAAMGLTMLGGCGVSKDDTTEIQESKTDKTDTDKNKEVIDEFTGCDKNKTKVIFYPEDPYGKTDYKIETELSCGTKDTKKK